MNAGRRRKARRHLASVIAHILGTLDPAVVWLAALFLLVFGVATNLISDIAPSMLELARDPSSTGDFLEQRWPHLLLFAACTAFLFWQILRVSSEINNLRVVVDPVDPESEPSAVKVLLVFLSRPNDENLKIMLADPSQTPCPVLRDAIAAIHAIGNPSPAPPPPPPVAEHLKRFSWTMPLIAAWHHRRTLRTVVVVPSHECAGSQTEAFIRIAEHAFAPEALRCIVVSQLNQPAQTEPILPGSVDYEDPAIIDAVHQVWTRLLQPDTPLPDFVPAGLKPKNVIIDITSGQRLAAVAAAVSAFGSGRLFQYVSTKNYRVCFYDVNYRD